MRLLYVTVLAQDAHSVLNEAILSPIRDPRVS